MKKYIFLILGVILVLGISLIFLNKKETKTNIENIKVAEVTHSIFYTPFYVAIENGYFEEENINIDLMLVSGSDNVAASVLSGDTQIGLAGPESAVFVYNGGEKNYLQIFSGLTKRDGQFIISKNKGFDWNDLKGKEILIGRKTGMPGLSFLKALENKGIEETEVNINSSVEFAELSGAFLGGTGDFVNLFEPTASKLEKEGYGYVVESVGLASDAFPYTAFYARKSFINDNKNLLKRFNRALEKGMKFTLENDSDIVSEVIKNQFKDTNIEELAQIIERYRNSDVWLSSTLIEEDFFNTLIRLLKDNKLIEKDVDYKSMVNNLND